MYTSLLKPIPHSSRPKCVFIITFFVCALFTLVGVYIYSNGYQGEFHQTLRKHPKQLDAMRPRVDPTVASVPFDTLIQDIGTSNKFLYKVDYAPLAITLIASDPEKEVAKLSLRNKYEYAKRHDYSLMVRKPHLLGRSPAWSKMGAILEAFDLGYPLVWMVDLDTIVTNFSIPLHRLPEPFLVTSPKKSVFLSKDCNNLNTGSFLIRNTPWSNYCLNQINASYHELGLQKHPWCEQEGLIRYYHSNISWSTYIQEVPDILLNMYPIENHCRTLRFWQPGDFLLHFAGIMHGDNNKELYIRRYNETLSLTEKEDPSFTEERYVQFVHLWYQLRQLLGG